MDQERAKYLFDQTSASLQSLAKVLLISSFRSRQLPRADRNKLVVFGNGPSFSEAAPQLPPQAEQATYLGVNFFVESDWFDILQPSHYVISAPEFWLPKVTPRWASRRARFFEHLSQRTSWPMHLLLPAKAKGTAAIRDLAQSAPRLKLHYYNTTPVEGYPALAHGLYRRNLGMPRPQNVLIPSLMLGINMGFREIYLLGADHNWLPEIRVMEDNTVLLTQKHFYDYQEAKAKSMKWLDGSDRRLHEILHKFYHSFRAYFLIREYAEQEQVDIYNATPGSFIDAFPRKTLSAIFS